MCQHETNTIMLVLILKQRFGTISQFFSSRLHSTFCNQLGSILAVHRNWHQALYVVPTQSVFMNGLSVLSQFFCSPKWRECIWSRYFFRPDLTTALVRDPRPTLYATPSRHDWSKDHWSQTHRQPLQICHPPSPTAATWLGLCSQFFFFFLGGGEFCFPWGTAPDFPLVSSAGWLPTFSAIIMLPWMKQNHLAEHFVQVDQLVEQWRFSEREHQVVFWSNGLRNPQYTRGGEWKPNPTTQRSEAFRNSATEVFRLGLRCNAGAFLLLCLWDNFVSTDDQRSEIQHSDELFCWPMQQQSYQCNVHRWTALKILTSFRTQPVGSRVFAQALLCLEIAEPRFSQLLGVVSARRSHPQTK